MGFAGFHPIVRQWFTTEVGEPTSAQLRGWDAIAAGRHTLIAAPTGSGKTLAAFLTAINALLEERQHGPLPDEVRILYVSPLKALSADIHKNLAEPRAGVHRLAEAAGLPAPGITAAVRTGDTTSSERAAMLRTPPHILVTTPESLYLLLTSERSRQMLRTVRTVIVDEIHAVIGTRRGAHLALSLERLVGVADRPLQRIGLSATQTPIEEVARFLTAGDAVGLRHHRRRPPAHDGPGRRAAALHTRRRDVSRGVGGVLRPPDRAHHGASDNVGFREHAAPGGTAGAAPQRTARRRRGDGTSREPVEGEAARRRNPAEVRTAEGARRDRLARARHRHRPRRPRLPDRIAAPDRHAAAARRPVGPHDCRHAQGPGAFRYRATISWSARRFCARFSPACSTPSSRTTRRSTCWRSRSSPSRRAATIRKTISSRW